MSNKKILSMVLTLLGTIILFFCILKTKSLYFSDTEKPLIPFSINKTDSEFIKSNIKKITIPKLTVFGNEKINKEKIAIESTPLESELETKDNNQVLTTKYLNQVLSQQQIYFTRCYENHLRENAQTSEVGTMLIEFMVLPHGEIRDVIIKESDFSDKVFENCIKTVFSRTQVKKFNSEKFLITYPLEFE